MFGFRQLGIYAAVLVCLCLANAAHGADQNNTQVAREGELTRLYADILRDHTSDGWKRGKSARFVDYATLQSDDRWTQLMNLLAGYPREKLDTAEKRKAFYLNAYNILSINMVVEHWPLTSLKSLGSVINPVWAHDAGIVAGEPVTLRYLENDVLRAMGDPRVHMAINCASMSCPDLRTEPYVASRLDEQLDDQARRFLRQENKGVVWSEDGKKLHLSSIFDWFEEDFEVVGGVEAFVQSYLPSAASAERFVADIPYDWGVNADFSGSDFAHLRKDF